MEIELQQEAGYNQYSYWKEGSKSVLESLSRLLEKRRRIWIRMSPVVVVSLLMVRLDGRDYEVGRRVVFDLVLGAWLVVEMELWERAFGVL